MPRTIEGDLHTGTGQVAIVAARFNQLIVEPLTRAAIDTLRRHGITKEAVTLVHVPGSFEIPLVAKRLAQTKRYNAVICLGCIIRGDTDHYDHVAGAATSGILNAGMDTGIPVIFGVLTCDSLEQALHRAGAKVGNKGAEAAQTAIEMMSLLEKIANG